MKSYPGKYIIGLTGNIATGKSIVRGMLTHLGAYCIDADSLAHQAIEKGAPGYQKVVDIFGQAILDENGEINRQNLGLIVFNEPSSLQQLENIIHPLVEAAVDALIRNTQQYVIVVEAIKLLEGGLREACNSIWTVYAPEALQIARLVNNRKMDRKQAVQRIRSQASQDEKVAAADVVITNVDTFDDTWNQVVSAWKKIPWNGSESAISRD